ncbi:hypothetical protein VPNG_05321 [Cytospora leucostoma]|uniref:superoxide dismutase n=1 Tax=Cytospora leucostoma TaxID=1230097 RepID=A0A423X4N8_9PEZI|nr:hypothetical protein VPNG_05321 [Cytospora leucostoma]
MRMTILTPVLAAVAGAAAQSATATSGVATVVTNNPAGAVYTATLPDKAFDTDAFPDGGNVKGSVYALSSPDGTGVIFQVKFSGLPSEGGPFLYHIHDNPVPADGNCTSTGGHLDPFSRGDKPTCDSSAPETCQVGDLSGKWGKITSDPFSATYTDDYVSLVPGSDAFFGNRSFVIHYANVTRISCANFTLVNTGSSSCSGSSPSTTGAPTPSLPLVSVSSRPTTTGGFRGSNATASLSSPSGTSTIVQAGAGANGPALMLAIGAAALALFL